MSRLYSRPTSTRPQIVQIFNQTYVPALYQTVTLDIVNFCWDIYMTLTLAGSDNDTDSGEDRRKKEKK